MMCIKIEYEKGKKLGVKRVKERWDISKKNVGRKERTMAYGRKNELWDRKMGRRKECRGKLGIVERRNVGRMA